MECQPTPVLLPGEFHGQRRLEGYSRWGHRVRHDWVTALLLLLSVGEVRGDGDVTRGWKHPMPLGRVVFMWKKSKGGSCFKEKGLRTCEKGLYSWTGMQLEGEQDTAGTFQLLPLFGVNLSTCWQICCLTGGEVHRGESGLWGQECGLWGSLGAGHRTLPFSAPRHLEPPSEATWLPRLPSWLALWCSRPALPGTTAGYPREEEAITEVLWGESEPLPELLFFVLWASEVPKRRVSYTGSTLLPQAATEEKAHLRQGSLKSR